MLIDKYNMGEEDKKFLLHEIELLEKKSGKERKPTASQLENEKYKEAILKTMEKDRLYACAELSKVMREVGGLEISVNKMSALLRQMVEAKTVIRTEEKRKAYFSKAQ